MYFTHQARAPGAATLPQPKPVRLFAAAALAVLAALFALAAPTAAHSDTLTVYSARNEQLLKPLLDQFTKATGTQVGAGPDHCVQQGARARQHPV